MNIGIIYESKTGNTKLIAESIKEACEEEENKIIFKSVEEAREIDIKDEDIDLYFLGSWTNKGDCGDRINEFCKSLNKEKIALFGTAGFGASKDYYEGLAKRFFDALPEDNKVIDYYYCQGRMPSSIRDRYVSILTKNPEDRNFQVGIENFDQAQSHPDQEDMENAKAFAKEMIRKSKEI